MKMRRRRIWRAVTVLVWIGGALTSVHAAPSPAASGSIPPPDETHAMKPIGVCRARHFDPRMEFCDARDNHLYRTTTIAGQTWMASNLDYGTMTPGSQDQTAPGQKYCLGDQESDCGALYQWAEAAGLDAAFNRKSASGAIGWRAHVKGICPDGWRLPSSADWEQLLAVVRKEQGAAQEAVSLMTYSADDNFRWKSNTSPDAMLPLHDRYGMAVVPSGQRVLMGTCPDGPASNSFFCSAHDEAKFWTADEDPSDGSLGVDIGMIEDLPYVRVSSRSVFDAMKPNEKAQWHALAREKAKTQSPLQRSYRDALKLHGLSVRCIRDAN